MVRGRDVREPNYESHDPVEGILASIADSALIPLKVAPHHVADMEREDQNKYDQYQDSIKNERNRQSDDLTRNLKINEDAREGEKFMREKDKEDLTQHQSSALTDAVLAQYPELKLEDVAGKDSLALANLIETQKTRRMMQHNATADRQAAINDRFDQGKLEGLSKRVEKSGAPEIEGSLNVVDSLIAGKKDIPGVGMLDSLTPDFLVSEEGKTIRRNLAGIANQILKSRSGAAVTDPEYARFLNEAMTGKLTSEASLKSGLVKMRQDLNNMKSSIAKGYNPKIVKMYQDNGGNLDLGTNQNGKTVVKTQTNPKTGQKRVIYSDGTAEIL